MNMKHNNPVSFLDVVDAIFTTSCSASNYEYEHSGTTTLPTYENYWSKYVPLEYILVDFKPTSTIFSGQNFPPCDLWINKLTKEMKIKMALAGVKKEQISLKLEDGKLILEVDKNEDKQEESWELIQNGIKKSSFKGTYTVPQDKYDYSSAKVDFKDGILLITIQAREDAKPQILKIE